MTAEATHLRLVPTEGTFDDEPREVDVPPHDSETERTVLGGCLLDESCVARVEGFLRPEHFFEARHSRLYEAILAVRAAKQPVDMTHAGRWLREHGRLEACGGMAYLTELLACATAITSIATHAAVVHGLWRRREVIRLCQRTVAEAYHGSDRASGIRVVPDANELAGELAKSAARIEIDDPAKPIPTNGETLKKILRALVSDATKGATMQGYPTGLATLDQHLGGLAPGHKLTIAATTGAGKTAFVGQLAVQVAKLGVGVLFFSTEVTREEVLFRALANEAGVDSGSMKRLDLDSHAIGRLGEAVVRLRSLPWLIDETPCMTVEELRAKTIAHCERSRLVDKVPVGLVIVDYVQRLSASRHLMSRERHHQIAHATRVLKQLAQELQLCVVELAQAKTFDRQKNGVARMPNAENGICDSSQIAKEADEVVFLVPQGRLENGAVDVSAYIAKQRGGPKAIEVSLEYHGAMYRFEDPGDPLRPASRDFLGEAP